MQRALTPLGETAVLNTNRKENPLQIVRAYVSMYVGLAYLGVICLLWNAVALILRPLLPARIGRPLGTLAVMLGFRSYLIFLTLIGAIRFDLRELDALRRERRPLILAPNHPTLLDAVIIISRFPDLACIMKAELMNNIFLGCGARLAGYIRNTPPIAMIKQSVASLQRGQSLLLFPEGTRTVQQPVNRFKASIALIAQRSQMPVQTLLIETDSPYLSKGWGLFRRPVTPIHFRVRCGRRFEATGEDSAAFVAELENYFRAALTPSPLAAEIDAETTLDCAELNAVEGSVK